MSIRQQMPGQVGARLLFPRVNPRFELPGTSDGVEHPAGQQWRWVCSSTDQDWAPRVPAAVRGAGCYQVRGGLAVRFGWPHLRQPGRCACQAARRLERRRGLGWWRG